VNPLTKLAKVSGRSRALDRTPDILRQADAEPPARGWHGGGDGDERELLAIATPGSPPFARTAGASGGVPDAPVMSGQGQEN
jgi:hypothetical protein